MLWAPLYKESTLVAIRPFGAKTGQQVVLGEPDRGQATSLFSPEGMQPLLVSYVMIASKHIIM